MRQRKRKSIAMVLVFLLSIALWSGPVLLAAPSVEPPPETNLTMSADSRGGYPGDTINFTIGFNLLSGAISGYTATQIVVLLPTGLDYVSSVSYVGGMPTVITTVPVATPAGASLAVTFDNNTMTPGPVTLIVTAKIAYGQGPMGVTARAYLYLQPYGRNMPTTPNQDALFGLTILAPAAGIPIIPLTGRALPSPAVEPVPMPTPVTPVTPQVARVSFNLAGGVRTGGGELVQYVPIGTGAVAPIAVRSGYIFTGWDAPYANVQADIVVTAQWVPDTDNVGVTPPIYTPAPPPVVPPIHIPDPTPVTPVVPPVYTPPPTPVTPQMSRVTFNLNGGVRVGGGALLQAIPMGGAAVEPYVFREGYIFLGWDVPFNNVRRDTQVTAQWTRDTDIGMITIEPPIYTFVPGNFVDNRSAFIQFGHMPLIYYAERHVAAFVSVEVDGNALTAGTHFVATAGTAEGTTAIHLKASYLNTLAAGTHAMKVNFRDDIYATAEFTVEAYRNTFMDVSANDWFYKGVQAMHASGLLMGVTTTQFDPYSSMTRGMVVTLLYRFTGEPSITGFINPFPDVAAGQYYTNAVMWAAANGIVTGHDNGLFAPSDLMTNEQFAAVLYRYQNALGSETLDILMDRTYSDFNQISNYARSAVNKLTMQGVFRDLPYDPANRFQPTAAVTRAQVATVMRLWIESIGW